ncbi:beta-barrel assembly-enhancing protease precursor [mine drainage metagenome]|uniref:Beta-barrel assembly-enhancing protease n=1 Tax=mine drainage metagenome TaxID=410659 RepID=A0A1J5Q478_9ZZZZ
MSKRLLALLLLFCLAPAVMADGLPDLGEASQVYLTPAMENRIGKQAMQEIRLSDPSYLDDPEITGYINRLGMRLVAQSSDAGQTFKFFVLKDPTINAFAMPGGFIGVHTGLILAAHSESELASVLAHEISHVTQHHMARQLGLQSQAQLPMLLSMAVAILAARSNSDVSMGAMMAGQAGAMQHQLSYSRDFEREADRMGLKLLERAGFDVRAMATFFKRLQKNGRLYENSAPSYLLTHPLTTERIADMENRIATMPYRQVPDSLDFQLVRAKLQAEAGTPEDAVTEFASQVKERKFSSEIAARYGLARAQLRAKNYAAAEHELEALRRLKAKSSMIESLAAQLRMSQNDPAGALKILRAALLLYPQERALAYAQVEDLLAAGQQQQALRATVDDLQNYPSDVRMHGLQAKTYAALGKHLEQHRAQAEVYALQGRLLAAIEQLQLAQKAGDGDFYERSAVDSRLRELKLQQAREAKDAKQQKP